MWKEMWIKKSFNFVNILLTCLLCTSFTPSFHFVFMCINKTRTVCYLLKTTGICGSLLARIDINWLIVYSFFLFKSFCFSSFGSVLLYIQKLHVCIRRVELFSYVLFYFVVKRTLQVSFRVRDAYTHSTPFSRHSSSLPPLLWLLPKETLRSFLFCKWWMAGAACNTCNINITNPKSSRYSTRFYVRVVPFAYRNLKAVTARASQRVHRCTNST